jgi:hypothetical protein
MNKKECNFLFCGCIFAGLFGGVFKAFFGFTPNVNTVIALTIASFAFNVAFMVALLIAPVKRVLWDTQDAYFITRLRRLCNLLETSALTSLALCLVLALTPQTFVYSLAWTSAFVVWFDAYKTLSALSNCIQYPTNPY